MQDRGERRRQTKKVIKKRLKQVKSTKWHPDKMMSEPHRMAKKHPFDCGNPKCGLCSREKINKDPKIRDLRRKPDIDLDDDVEL